MATLQCCKYTKGERETYNRGIKWVRNAKSWRAKGDEKQKNNSAKQEGDGKEAIETKQGKNEAMRQKQIQPGRE